MAKQPMPVVPVAPEAAGVDAGLVVVDVARATTVPLPALNEDGSRACAREECGANFRPRYGYGFRLFCSDECATLNFYKREGIKIDPVRLAAAVASGKGDVEREALLIMKSGPIREIEEVLSETPTGKSRRVRLTCGHEITVLKDAKNARCRACRDVEAALARIEPTTITEDETIVDAVQFCRLFSPVLIKEEWGDLDPTWFQEIATKPPDKLSNDARLLWEDLNKALGQPAPPEPAKRQPVPLPVAPAAVPVAPAAVPAASKRQPVPVVPPAILPADEPTMVAEMRPIIEAYLTAQKVKDFTPEMITSAATHAVRAIVGAPQGVPVKPEAAVKLAVQQEKTAAYWSKKNLNAPVESKAAEPKKRQPVPVKAAAAKAKPKKKRK